MWFISLTDYLPPRWRSGPYPRFVILEPCFLFGLGTLSSFLVHGRCR